MASCTFWLAIRSAGSSRVEKALLVAACLFTAAASAQEPTSELRVRLKSTDGAPVSGALVALLADNDSVVAEGLTGETGMRTLRAPPGSYRVRVRRIGYLPFVSGPVAMPRELELALGVESPRVVLEGIVVTSRSRCRRNDPNDTALATVWDEIDKALRSSQLLVSDLKGMGKARVYRRERAGNGRIVSGDSTVFQISGRRPFGAIDPTSLASDGYVIGDEGKGWVYYAPDEVVLLSDGFASTHCFRLVRDPARRSQIGVAFEPVPGRTVSDISGVLWVDEKTSELREVVFRFVNARVLSLFDARGFTRFLRVPSGAFIVEEWLLSVPKLSMKTSVSYRPQYTEIGRFENGGGIVGPVVVPIKERDE